MPNAASLLLLAGACVLSPADRDWDRKAPYKFEDKSEIRRTLSIPDAGRPLSLIVDTVWGGIDVQAGGDGAVEIVARRTIRAKSPEKIAKAKADVVLKIEPDGNDLDLYVDGPFRCHCSESRGYNSRETGYEVSYDFVLKVPRRTNLTLKTVLDGAVAVRGVEGEFDVSNVNGGVALDGVAGSGRARAVNGGLKAAFAKNPAAPCDFKTVNGDIELLFRDGLAADFRMSSMHGQAYFDFPVTSLPAEPATRENRDGKLIIKRGGTTGARIGRGGVSVRCETLNGDILVKKQK